VFGITGFALHVLSLRCSARGNAFRLGESAARKPGCEAICGSASLSLPMILLHGGIPFWGGTLTRVLMWLTIITVGSGLYGAA